MDSSSLTPTNPRAGAKRGWVQRDTYPLGGHKPVVLSIEINCSFYKLHHTDKKGRKNGGGNWEGGSRAAGLNTLTFFRVVL